MYIGEILFQKWKNRSLQSKVTEANRRLNIMAKLGLERLTTYEKTKNAIEKRYGEKAPVKFKLRGQSEKDRKYLEREVDAFLKSSYTTSKGRNDIQRRIDERMQHNGLNVKKMDKKTKIMFYDILNTSAFRDLAEAGRIDSKQIIDSFGEVVNEQSKRKIKNTDISQIERILIDVKTIDTPYDYIQNAVKDYYNALK